MKRNYPKFLLFGILFVGVQDNDPLKYICSEEELFHEENHVFIGKLTKS